MTYELTKTLPGCYKIWNGTRKVQRGSIFHSIHENVSGGVGVGSNLIRQEPYVYIIMSLSRPPVEERVRTSYRRPVQDPFATIIMR